MNKSLSPKKYQFQGVLWKYDGPGGWCFVNLPIPLTLKVRKNHLDQEEGWGRLKAQACIKESKWETAIWYSSKDRTYLLPVKASVRKELKLEIGATIKVHLTIEVEKYPLKIFSRQNKSNRER